MAITSLAGYLAAPKYRIPYRKDSNSLVTGGLLGSLWSASGDTGTGSLAIGDTSAGIVPTDATTGAPAIPDFSGTGYLTGVEFCGYDGTLSSGTQIWLYDRLYHAGSFSNAVGTTSLSGQPSFSSRVPGGDYSGIEVFAELNGVATSTTTLNITYTDQSGNTGHTSPSITTSASSTTPRLYKIPLASGDSGIQTLESFVVSASGTGTPTWNIVIARRLCRVSWLKSGASNEVRYWIDRTGMRQIYNNSCLWTFGVATGLESFVLDLEIASG